MGMRKNQATLTANEKARFVAAVLQLKANGGHDLYVRQHRDLFNANIHRTAWFFPWHREFLLRLERDLQAIDPTVTLPYWDWTIDRLPSASLWADDFMGGNGVPPGGAVQSGPFAFRNGRWTLNVRDNPRDPIKLERALGSGGPLPTGNAVRDFLTRVPYAVFRPALENQVHDIVHVWIGGSAAMASSPNDPAFFLLHCNVDRLWAQWQALHPGEAAYQSDGPGRGVNDPMLPWNNEVNPPTPARVLDHTALGYTYDTDVEVPPVDLTVGAPPTQASIGQPGELDWYRFVVPAAGGFTIETQGPTDVFMSLFGPNSQIALVTEDDDSGQDANATIASNLSAGTYFVRIRHFQTAGVGSYGISVRGAAQPLLIPEIPVNGPAVQGDIAAANESDVYTFAASVTGTYTIETAGNTDTFLTLLGPNSQTAFITQDDDSGPGSNSRIVRALMPGAYFLRLRHYSATGTGPYSIFVRR
jgi:tyrosinase